MIFGFTPDIGATVTTAISFKDQVNTILEALAPRGTDFAAWDRLRHRMAAIRLLENNWDGEDADAPSAELLDSLEVLFEKLREDGSSAPTRVAAAQDGSLTVDWSSPLVSSSLEVSLPYEGQWLIRRPGYPPQFRDEKWSRKTRSPSLNSSSSESLTLGRDWWESEEFGRSGYTR